MASRWSSAPRRLVLSRLLPVGLLGVVVAAGVAALLVDDDATDTVLGAITGASAMLLLGAVLVQVLVARADRGARDRMALDGLEPLRAAQRDTRRTAPRAVPGEEPRPSAPAPAPRSLDDEIA
ncbi:hypothetical protein [Aquipuribacter sp. MA13-6]|uniref:hypothetical protein n=1 Tax=unclassified Aquipuribacter TaxID=2635084 RepID=UPI003EECBA18